MYKFELPIVTSSAQQTVTLNLSNLLSSLRLQLMMSSQNTSDPVLKVERSLLQLGMHLSINKNTRIEVLLSVITEPFIFCQNPLEHFIDRREPFVAGILVSVDFVFHGTVAN